MSAAGWARVRAAFDALLELEGEARTTRLAEIEAEDAALAEELRDLLSHDEEAEDFLRTSGPPPLAPVSQPGAGARIGSSSS